MAKAGGFLHLKFLQGILVPFAYRFRPIRALSLLTQKKS